MWRGLLIYIHRRRGENQIKGAGLEECWFAFILIPYENKLILLEQNNVQSNKKKQIKFQKDETIRTWWKNLLGYGRVTLEPESFLVF